ncbi:F-box/WD repeat-containing protein 8 [Geodia barretti]|uniref:F-box/WD repeat-containing protein 8 n=1 Tax=Geodia barretti TaxID=519541 RepID=A0AA35WQN1_GEOBA|nr:F-box/WD repeat-containing protein 8 [Geodia barretti]
MDGDLAVKKTLQQFVAEWKQELVTPGPPGGLLLGKREDRQVEEEEEEEEEEEKAAEIPTQKKLSRREPSPLLVLPPGQVEKTASESFQEERESKQRSTPSLLDTLIADLDDINTVPFFEVKLARELALLIFRHLDMVDLCTCARVSRSWRSLAEDNILWGGVCQKMGYDTATEDGRQVAWKAVVKEIVLRKKKELKNWKERVCGLSDLQPDRDGVLGCADFCRHLEQLLAGYSSGAVYVWTLTSEEGPLVLESGHAHLMSSRPVLCRISRGWAAVATEHGEVTVYDSCVGGAVHRARGLGHVTSLDLRWSHASLIVGVATSVTDLGPGEVEPVARGEVTVLVCREGSDWQTLVVNPLLDTPSPHTINQLAVLLEEVPGLLYSTQTTLSLHPLPSSPPHPPPPPPSHILTSAGSAGATVINCFDHTSSIVACATSAWGYHVQLYDLCTSGHLSTLRGHAQPVTSLNIHSSPPNTLVTGAADRRYVGFLSELREYLAWSFMICFDVWL